MGLKMGVRSCRSCGVHRSWGWSGSKFGLAGLMKDSSTKPDRDRANQKRGPCKWDELIILGPHPISLSSTLFLQLFSESLDVNMVKYVNIAVLCWLGVLFFLQSRTKWNSHRAEVSALTLRSTEMSFLCLTSWQRHHTVSRLRSQLKELLWVLQCEEEVCSVSGTVTCILSLSHKLLMVRVAVVCWQRWWLGFSSRQLTTAGLLHRENDVWLLHSTAEEQTEKRKQKTVGTLTIFLFLKDVLFVLYIFYNPLHHLLCNRYVYSTSFPTSPVTPKNNSSVLAAVAATVMWHHLAAFLSTWVWSWGRRRPQAVTSCYCRGRWPESLPRRSHRCLPGNGSGLCWPDLWTALQQQRKDEEGRTSLIIKKDQLMHSTMSVWFVDQASKESATHWSPQTHRYEIWVHFNTWASISDKSFRSWIHAGYLS